MANYLKPTATLVVLLFAVRAAHGQGTIAFENSIATLLSTNSAPGGPATGLISGPMGSYYFALFAAPSGATDLNQFSLTGAYAVNVATPGAIYGGFPTIPGTQPGETVSLLVRGWSANIGHDYQAVTNYLANPTFIGWYGQSQIGTLPLGDDCPPPVLLFGPNQFPGFVQIPGFTLDMHVPEPTAFSLLELGAALLFFCRLFMTSGHRTQARRRPSWRVI